MINLEKLKFPIGKFEAPTTIPKSTLENWINDIASFPSKISQEVIHLNQKQLETPYRPQGWTIRQVVHHCADSHMNCLTRIKLALTEDNPIIKPYFEERWAELDDSKFLDIAPSLNMIESIHYRWVVLLKGLNEDQLARTYVHPGDGKTYRIDENTGLYAWHCNHHLSHITQAKKQNNWN